MKAVGKIGIKEALARIEVIPGCERIDGSTLSKHCSAGTLVGAEKSRGRWVFTTEALDNWQREYYKPRAPYVKWSEMTCPHCGGKVFQTENAHE